MFSLKSNYPFKHWMTSLALGPLLAFFYGIFFNPDYQFSTDIFGWYMLFFGFSLFFSLPVFIIYTLLFNLFLKVVPGTFLIKILLNLISIISTFIVIKYVGGSTMMSVATAYAIAIVISSFFYKIKETDTTTISTNTIEE